MAKTYTIDEAAERLGVPLEEFKRRWKTEWTTVRTFRDGATSHRDGIATFEGHAHVDQVSAFANPVHHMAEVGSVGAFAVRDENDVFVSHSA